jgi:hypothetical protein
MDENLILGGGTKNNTITFAHPAGPLGPTNQTSSQPSSLFCGVFNEFCPGFVLT